MTVLRLLLALVFATGLFGQPPRPHLRLLDEKGRPVAARVQVLDADGKPAAMPGSAALAPIHPRNAALGVVVDREADIELPSGATRVRISRGTEYLPVETSPPGTVRLRRWIDMAGRGWWSGDLHVHRVPAEMPLLLEAADLHFAPTITRWNDQSNLDPWPERRLYTAGTNRAYSVDNCEDERGWGAALFFGVKSPPRLYAMKGNREYPPGISVWREARDKGAYIDLEKAIWWGAPVVAGLMAPDSIGVAVNHFLESSMMDSEAWGRPRDVGKYPGAEGFARYVFDLYYLYLNAGLRAPASAGSANGVLHNPLGYNRSYVYLAGRFSPESWWAGQKAGRNFVTNGPMLFLKVGGKLPGTVIEGANEVSVKLEALAAGELEKAEVVVDGAVVKTLAPSADRRRISGQARIKVRPGGWLAARCFEKSPVTIRFAHTSPVYFGRTPRRAPEALESLRAWIDAEMERIRQLSSITDTQREELLALCRQARRAYQ